jgi:hypothetical protein
MGNCNNHHSAHVRTFEIAPQLVCYLARFSTQLDRGRACRRRMQAAVAAVCAPALYRSPDEVLGVSRPQATRNKMFNGDDLEY